MLKFTTKTCVMVPASNIPVQAILLLCAHASTLLAGGRTVVVIPAVNIGFLHVLLESQAN